MKTEWKLPALLAIASAFALIVFSASAQPIVGEIETSAGPGTSESIAAAKAARQLKVEQAPTDMIHVITPVILPPKNDPNWGQAVDTLLIDAEDGQLGRNASTANPASYYLVQDHHIEWWNTVSSQSSPIYMGQLNPTGAFANSRGQVVGLLIESWSPSGVASSNDTVSLNQLSFSSVSHDENQLGSSYDFDGLHYTPRAFAIRANGTKITGGLTSGKGVRTFVVIMPKSFNGGATQEGLDGVRSWVEAYHPYRIDYTVRSTGVESRMMVTTGSVPTPTTPILKIVRADGVTRISIANGVAGRNYILFSEPSVGSTSAPPMTIEGVLSGNDPLIIQTSGEKKFFRARLQ